MPETMTPTRPLEDESTDTAQAVHDVRIQEASSYQTDYQPRYLDTRALESTVEELEQTSPIVDSREIDAVRSDYAEIAIGEDSRMILVTGPCSETISITRDFKDTKQRYLSLLEIGKDANAHQSLRACGQSAKPRSKELENDDTPSYYGDMINGIEIDDREPDPFRMLEAKDQAVEVKSQLERELGETVTISHEALLLPYEKASIRRVDGEDYLTSCHIPWVGMRTNYPDSEQVNMLATVQNPVGIKIGPGDTPEKITELAKKLNPDNKPGKLVFILRLGREELPKASNLVASIKASASKSIILCDPMHGNTVKTASGVKTREVPRIIYEINTIAAICESREMRLHGLHLEASGRDDRLECVDHIGDEPEHESLVDPELNNDQLRRVLEATRMCFVDKRRIGKLATSPDGTIDLDKVLV